MQTKIMYELRNGSDVSYYISYKKAIRNAQFSYYGNRNDVKIHEIQNEWNEYDDVIIEKLQNNFINL